VRRATAFALLSVGAAIAINAVRILYGVDFTDESFYVSLAMRFARGDVPFVDEYNWAQSSELLLIPLVKVWLHVAGTNGIVLLFRVVHLLLRVGAAAIVARSLRRLIGMPQAIVASLLTFAFVPADLPSISYNTLGTLGLTAGIFAALHDGEHPLWYALAGAFHVVAAIAYPPLALPIALFVVIRLSSPGRRGFVLGYCGGGAIAILPYAVAALRSGIGAVLHSLSYASLSNPTAPLPERMRFLVGLWQSAPRHDVLIATALLMLAAAIFRITILRWLVPLVPLVAAWDRLPVLYSTMGFVTWLAIIGAFIGIGLWGNSDARRLLILAVLPGIVAGCTVSFFSSNGHINFGVGALPAAQAAVALLALLLQRRLIEHELIIAATLTFCWLIPTAEQFRSTAVYREDDIRYLRATVPRGPWAGLRTTPEKLAFITNLQRDLARVERVGGRVFFYYDFSAGYLMTPRMSPAGPSTWTAADARARVADQLPGWFAEHHRNPDVVVQMLNVRYAKNVTRVHDYPPSDPLSAAFSGYRVAIANDLYRVLVSSTASPNPVRP
jgi:hypothetical protein